MAAENSGAEWDTASDSMGRNSKELTSSMGHRDCVLCVVCTLHRADLAAQVLRDGRKVPCVLPKSTTETFVYDL